MFRLMVVCQPRVDATGPAELRRDPDGLHRAARGNPGRLPLRFYRRGKGRNGPRVSEVQRDPPQ